MYQAICRPSPRPCTSLVGGFLSGLVGSTPAPITTLAAVRQGALAVDDILDGNRFDALIVSFSAPALTGGTGYGTVGPHQDFLLALTLLTGPCRSW